ncbi:MAG: hypothetical protein ACRELA_12390 [Candidatus Rokuibacteriota bacterium]
MRQHALLCVVALAILCPPLAGETGEAAAWKTFTSKEGGFRVSMPGTPALTEATHKSVVGVVREYTYALETRNGDYSANYSVLPGIAVNLGGANAILDRAKKGLLQDVGGEETRFTDTAISGHPGKELTFRVRAAGGAKPMSGRARFYLVNKILYVLVATSSTPNDPDVSRFLDSFRLSRPG